MPEWDLSSIINKKQQEEIEKLTTRQKTAKRMSRFLCRLGWHRNTVWNQVGEIQMANLRPDGTEVPWEFALSMRCCTHCLVPEVKVVRA